MKKRTKLACRECGWVGSVALPDDLSDLGACPTCFAGTDAVFVLPKKAAALFAWRDIYPDGAGEANDYYEQPNPPEGWWDT